MSAQKPFLPWFENLNRAYQVVIITLSLLGLVGGALTIGASFWVAVMDHRIALRVDPMADMLEFSMKQSGQWEAFIEEKARRERDKKLREPLQAGARLPHWLPIITD